MRLLTLTTAILLLATACGGGEPKEPATTAPAEITVTSTAFREGGAIPSKYTCDGIGAAPPLAWTGTPSDAKAIALVVDDPDAPNGTFTHWIVLDLPPTTTVLTEVDHQANNSEGKPEYTPFCPPSGTHHYRFNVYALSQATNLADGSSLDEALKAIDSTTIARGRLTGVYRRQ
ncbi:YbhB/YbcL family Raf kinase inhibitor-like protein [Kribbella sp. NPDC026611]|uniref:YbhB/YbcL family Raf kinase inhibitor-like protein n=1 Tax=Kribbella sp. NPDC026611 TaxID=3154911 RepID=UPI0034071E8B